MGFGLDDLKNLDDVKDVWNNLEEKNWQGLFNAIRKVREEKGDNETLGKLEDAGHQENSNGADFPDSPTDLAKLLHR